MRTRFVLPVIALAALPQVSHAQLGGLIKKAKDAAAQKVEAKSNVKPSETYGPELTSQSLDAVIRGLSAQEAKLDVAKSIAAERDRIYKQVDASTREHEKERQSFDDNHRRIEHCQDSIISARQKATNDAFTEKVKTDPAARAQLAQEATEMGRQMALLQQKGDTAGYHKLLMDMMKRHGVDPAADSAVAIKSCGPLPTAPAWYVEQDTLRARANRLNERERTVQDSAQMAGEAAAGMARKDYALARERLVNYYHETHGGNQVQMFGADERKLLDARKSELEKYKRVLQ